MTTPANMFRRRAGAASIIAIALIGLVGAVLAMLGTAFAADAKRTRSEASEAQLRQLMTAAAASATQNPAFDQPRQLALPPQLQPSQASVTLTSKLSNDTAIVTIDAKLGARRMEQTLTLKHEGDRWVLTAVRQM